MRGDLFLGKRVLILEDEPIIAILLEELIEATTLPKDRLCRACFDGVYPVELPEPELLGKHVLEVIERRAHAGVSDVEGVTTVLGGGAADALDRP